MTFTTKSLAAGFVALALVALAALAGSAGADSASDTTTLPAFELHSLAAALRWEVSAKASPVPAENTIDLSIPFSAGDLSTGPSGHALASTAWPGDTLAKACTADPQVPCYKIDAEAFSPQGPADASNNQIAQAVMTAHAAGLTATADAHFTPQGAPGFSVGPLSSTSSDTIVNNLAVSQSEATLSNLDIGGGAIHIGSIVSTAKATSDGTKGDASGGTTLTGATIGGVPVTIDQAGVHLTVKDVPNPLNQVLNATVTNTLAQQGISLVLAGPVITKHDSLGDIVDGGLLITLNDSALVSLLPASVKSSIPVDPTGKTTIVLGEASAHADAGSSFDSGGATSDGGSADTGGAVLGATLGSAGVGGSALPSLAPAPTSNPSPSQSISPAPVAAAAVGGTPLPAWLVVLAILVALAAASGLRRFATAVHNPVAATTCPLEARRE
jgi:hypothetical protein